MRRFGAVLVGGAVLLLLCSPARAEQEPVVKAWNNFLVVTAPGGQTTPEDIVTRAQLQQCRITFSFEETPFAEAVEFLSTVSGLNFVVHREAGLEALDVTLTLKNVSCQTALEFVTGQVGLSWTVRHGTVLIGRAEDIIGPMTTHVYDVTDLLAVPPDFEGPATRWAVFSKEEPLFPPTDPDKPEKHEKSRQELMEELVVIVEGMLKAHTWETSNFP